MLNTLNKKVSLFLIVLAAGYLYAAYNLKKYPYVPVDADAVPKVLGYLLIGLAIILFFDKSSETEEDKEKRNVPKKEIPMMLGVGVLIFLYIFLLEILGFVVTSALFIFGCSLFLGYRRHVMNAVVSITVPLVMYITFTYLLNIVLPQGILPF